MLVALSVVVFAAGLVLAATTRRASYTPDEVVTTFAGSEFRLEALPPTRESAGGWTGYAPLQPPANGTFFVDESNGEPRFYVFVARSHERAREFFAPLAQGVEGPGVLDRLEGNVVVNSQTALTDDERRRIEAALRNLADSG